jgi:hypothetical protein
VVAPVFALVVATVPTEVTTPAVVPPVGSVIDTLSPALTSDSSAESHHSPPAPATTATYSDGGPFSCRVGIHDLPHQEPHFVIAALNCGEWGSMPAETSIPMLPLFPLAPVVGEVRETVPVHAGDERQALALLLLC